VETHFDIGQGAIAAEVRGGGRAVVDAGPRFELREASIDIELNESPIAPGALGVRIEAPVARYASAELLIERPRAEIKSAGSSHIQIEGSFAADTLALSGGDVLAVRTPALEVSLAGDSVPGGEATVKAHAPALDAGLEGQTLRMEELSAEAYGLTMRAS